MSSRVTVLPFRKTPFGKLTRRAKTKWLRLQKWLFWHALSSSSGKKRIVLIVGCQRSGTSLLGRIFERDYRTTVLHEDSCITGVHGQRLRLKSYPEVNRLIRGFRTPLVVAKPLAESQNTCDMLNEIPRSKAIWMFRHYRNVANSSVNRFRNQIRHLKAIVEGDRSNWHAERATAQTRSLLSRCFSEQMSRNDAAALMWYARNTLFFDQQLDSHPDASMCKYEDLVKHPEETTQGVYRFVGMEYPRKNITSMVDSNSVRLGRDLALSVEVDELCSGLLKRLEGCYRGGKASLESDQE